MNQTIHTRRRRPRRRQFSEKSMPNTRRALGVESRSSFCISLYERLVEGERKRKITSYNDALSLSRALYEETEKNILHSTTSRSVRHIYIFLFLSPQQPLVDIFSTTNQPQLPRRRLSTGCKRILKKPLFELDTS